jgi:hypothetical protein
MPQEPPAQFLHDLGMPPQDLYDIVWSAAFLERYEIFIDTVVSCCPALEFLRCGLLATFQARQMGWCNTQLRGSTPQGLASLFAQLPQQSCCTCGLVHTRILQSVARLGNRLSDDPLGKTTTTVNGVELTVVKIVC